MSSSPEIVAAVIASAGRSHLLGSLVADLRRQTRPPDVIVLSVPDSASLPSDGIEDCVITFEGGGAAAQRNAGMDAAPAATIFSFFDDDSIVHPAYLERAIVHLSEPEVIGVTGRVLIDGARGDAVDRLAGEAALAAAGPLPDRGTTTPSRGLYGCNFVVRRLPEMDRFDDRLPLYSWLEDRDFSYRFARRGRLVMADDCLAVHLGAPSGGRTAHVRLGYTQVMNPFYMLRKGSFGPREAFTEIVPRVVKNLVCVLIGKDRAWRERRLRGNLIAVGSLLRGRVDPGRMTTLH